MSPAENPLNSFDFEGAAVRIVSGTDGEPWWVAKDVAEALGYTWNGSARVEHVPEEWRGVTSVVTLRGDAQDMVTISEQGLYFFLARSDKPAALPFQRWIAGEVLPSIRKTGSYSVSSTFSTPKTLSEALRLAADLEDQRHALELKVKEDAPKVEFAMAVRNCEEAMAVGKFAKVLGAGEVRFYRWMREAQILFKSGKVNLPYQRFLDLGYFRVVENLIYMGSSLGYVPTPQTLVTGKGQVWLQRRWSECRGGSA